MGPNPLEEVVDWKVVVDKYLQLIGQRDGTGEDDQDDLEDEEAGDAPAPAAAGAAEAV